MKELVREKAANLTKYSGKYQLKSSGIFTKNQLNFGIYQGTHYYRRFSEKKNC